jgi:hypothetical protein
MTEEQRDSTFSDETATLSTEWADIVDLGKAIASQLSIDDHDTLARWMAFRIAELLRHGGEDESVRADVTGTILQLWAHRRNWPTGWPPERARRQLRWLFGPGHGDHPEATDAKAKFMSRVVSALSDEYQFWLWATSSETDPEDDDRWEVFRSYIPWTERRMIRRLNELSRLAAEVNDESAADGETDAKLDRGGVARTELNSLLRARRSLLSEALTLYSSEPADSGPTSDSTNAT